MQKVIDAIIAALKSGGFSVAQSGSSAKLPRLSAAKTAVCLQRAVCQSPIAFRYVGMQTLPGGSEAPLYGCKASIEAALEIFAPRALGAAACSEEAEKIMAFLLGGIAGVQMKRLELGACEFQPEADLFSVTIRLEAEGFVYALANEDDTEFTDFILKGEIK